jgi:hypothetical protein
VSRGLGRATGGLLGLALTAATLVGAAAGPAGGAPAQTTPGCSFDYCVGDQVPGPRPTVPGSGTGPGGTGPSGSTPSGGAPPPAPVCVWVHWQNASQNSFPLIPDPPSGEAELYLEQCDGVVTGRVRWVAPGQAPPPAPLSPAQLAEAIRVRLEGNLPTPSVTSSPGLGVAALIGFPSFVAVDNWSATVTDQQCDPFFGLCVSVVATPHLEWSPGEPGAATVACDGAGTRFDPGGAAPGVQAAAPGACAYAYRARTGVVGRPGEWPGLVTVRWALQWRSTAGGAGALPDVTKTAAVPRAVDEVQTVVESAG